jgi:hypothetical protein
LLRRLGTLAKRTQIGRMALDIVNNL